MILYISLVTGIPVAAIVGLKVHQRCHQHRHPQKADESANRAVIIFTLIFSTVCKIWTNLLSAGGTVSLILGACLLSAHMAYVFNLAKQTRILLRKTANKAKEESGSASSGRACSCCLPSAEGGVCRCGVCRGCVDCRCCLPRVEGGTCSYFKRCHAGCTDCFTDCFSGSAPLPASRLKAQLSYMVAKFGDHAPYWQFVLWARVLFILAIEALIPSSMPLLQSGVILAGIIFFLALHSCVQPYYFLFQNRLETALLVANGLLTALGMVYYVLREGQGRGVIDALLMTVLVGMPSLLLGFNLYARLSPTNAITVDSAQSVQVAFEIESAKEANEPSGIDLAMPEASLTDNETEAANAVRTATIAAEAASREADEAAQAIAPQRNNAAQESVSETESMGLKQLTITKASSDVPLGVPTVIHRKSTW